jgi:hypothetical protein
LAITAGVVGFLWAADGRLWPSVARYLFDNIFLIFLVQIPLDPWLEKSRWGRIPALVLNAIVVWVATEGLAIVYAEGGERETFLWSVVGLVLAWSAGSFAWSRLSDARRERLARLAASRAVRGVAAALAFTAVGLLLWFVLGAATEVAAPQARLGLTALLLTMGGGLALALWGLVGGVRALACWAIGSLTWAGLMTGLPAGGPLARMDVGGWLLAIGPPLIVGGVVFAYWRIARAYRV